VIRLRMCIGLFLTLVMTSCAATDTQIVKVPVPVECKKPPLIEPIDDPVLAMTDDTSIEDAVRTLRASRVLWREKAKELARLLVGYGANNPFE